MSTICSQSIKISGLAENLEKLYYRIQDALLLNEESYHTIFDNINDVEDWGSIWTVIHTKEYEVGDFMMILGVDSDWQPAEGFWQKISKDFELVVDLDYENPDLEYHYSTVYSDGKLIQNDRITYLEYLYATDYNAFWREVVVKTSPCSSDIEWSSFDEVVESLEGVIKYLNDDELRLLQDIYDKRYDNQQNFSDSDSYDD